MALVYCNSFSTKYKVQSKNKTKVIVIYTDVFRAWSNIQDQAFEKVVNSLEALIIFAKGSILDI